MSSETQAAIRDAIQAHFADSYGDGAVVTDWFVSFGGMRMDSTHGLVYTRGLGTSDGSPFGAYGIAQLGVEDLAETFSAGQSEDD